MPEPTPINPQPTDWGALSTTTADSWKKADDKVFEKTNDTSLEGDVRHFMGVDDAINYKETVLQPMSNYWEDNEEIKNQYIEKHGGDETAAYDDFQVKYQEAQDAELGLDRDKMEKVQLTAGWGGRFIDQEWFDYGDFEAEVFHDHKTLSGRMRLGDSWTAATQAVRQGQVEGRNYVNDQGELIVLGEEEEFNDTFFGFGNSLIYNDDHKSEDGRYIIGFEYPQADELSRGPGELKAIYQGERPQGEIVSYFDLTKGTMSFLNSNKLNRNAILDIPMAVARSGIGLLTNTIIGGTEALRSIITLLDSDNENAFLSSTQSMNTILKSYKISKTDEDMQSIVTWSNALDLLGDVVGQIALAGATSGASLAMMKGLQFGGKIGKLEAVITALNASGKLKKAAMFQKKLNKGLMLANGVAKVNTAFVYGAIAGDGIKQEAIAAGYSEDSASRLFLMYMAAVGGIGQMSNLMPHQFNSRVLSETSRQTMKNNIAIKGTLNLDNPRVTWGLAKRLVKQVNKGYGKMALKMAESRGWQGYTSAGLGEMFEEDLELAVEVALKHAWNASANVTGDDPNLKGFYTIHDPEFWAQLPAEFLLSTVAGFGGGMIGRALPFTGGHPDNISEEMLPYQGEDYLIMARGAHAAARRTQDGLRTEAVFFKDGKKALEKGELGSNKYTIDRDEKGRFRSKLENPNGKTIGEKNYDMMMMQYFSLKEQMKFNPTATFEEWVVDNPKIKGMLEDGTYVVGKYRQKNEELSKAYGNVDPLARKAYKEATIAEEEVESQKKKMKVATRKKEDAEAEKKVAAEEKKKEAEEKIEEGTATKAALEEAKEVTITDGPDAETQEEMDAAEEERNVLEPEEQERMERMAGALGVSVSEAIEITKIEKEIDDMGKGLTVERELKMEYLRTKPEYKILYEDEDLKKRYGDDFLDKLLMADEAQLKIELEKYNNDKEHLDKVIDYINAADSLDKVFDVSEVVGEDGKLMMSNTNFDILKAKVREGMDSLVTPEKFEEMKTNILGNLGLDIFYSTALKARGRPPKDPSKQKNRKITALQKSRELKRILVKSLNKAKSKEDKKKVITEFTAKYRDEIVRVTQARYILNQKTLGSLMQATIDTTGNANIAFFKRRAMTTDDDVGSGMDLLFNAAANRKALKDFVTEESNVVAVSDSLDASFKDAKLQDAESKWKDLSGKITTNIPRRSVDDLTTFMLRDMDLSNPNKIVTSEKSLFSKNYGQLVADEKGDMVFVPSEPGTLLSSPDMSLADDVRGGLQQLAEGVEVHKDPAAVHNLLKKLQIRKATIQLYSDPDFLAHIASIREYNAKTMAKADFYKPISEGDYNAYSKFVATYIFDPVRFRMLQTKHYGDVVNDTTTIVGDDLKAYRAMLVQIKVMKQALLPNIDRAILDAKEMLKAAENASDEVALSNAYKLGVGEYAQSVADDLVTFAELIDYYLLKDHPELKVIYDEMNALALKLTALDKKTQDDAEIKAMYKELMEAANYLYNISDDIKAILFSKDIILKSQPVLASFMLVDINEFYSTLQEMELDDVSTIIQDRGAFQAFAAQVSRSKDTGKKDKDGNPIIIPSLTSVYGHFENVVFIEGALGAGKTTMAMSIAVKAAQEYLEDQRGAAADGTADRVLLASKNDSQLEILITQADKAQLRIQKEIGANGKGLLLKELHELLDPDSDISELTKTLEKVSIIVFDEATLIQAGKSPKDEDNDFFRMKKAINLVNARRANTVPPTPPISLVLLGDPMQGGWVEGMPDAAHSNEPIDFSSITGVERNPGTLIAAAKKGMFKTQRLKYSFRVSVSEVDRVSKILASVQKIKRKGLVGIDRDRHIDEVVSAWGLLTNDGSTPKYGGIDFTFNEESIYDNDFYEHIKSQLETDPEFTMVFITEGGIDSLRNGKLKDLFRDPVNKKRLRVYSIDEAQGSEADYAIVVLPKGFLKPVGSSMTPQEAYTYRLLSMAVGRAKYFSRVVVSDDSNLRSMKKEDMLKVDKAAKADISEKWKKFKTEMFDEAAYPEREISTTEPPDVPPVGPPATTTEPTTPTITEPGSTGGLLVGDKKKSAEIAAGIVVKEDVEMNPDEVIDDAQVDAKLRAAAKAYGLSPDKTYEEHIKELEKELEDPAISEEDKKLKFEAREALLQLIEGSTAVEEDAILDPLTTREASKLLTGRETEDGDVSEQIGNLSEEADAMALLLDEEGFGILYTFNAKSNEFVDPVSANRWKYDYLETIFGSNRSLMSPKDIPHHMRRAAGLTDDVNAKNEYDYELVTWEYKMTEKAKNARARELGYEESADTMIVTTGVIAKHKESGESFLLARMPNSAALHGGTNMKTFIESRETELKSAVDAFKSSFEEVGGAKAKYDAAQGFTFEEFNSDDKAYTAHMQDTASYKPADKKKLKDRLSSGRKNKYGAFGSVYVSIDITQAMRGTKVLAHAMPGAIITSSESIKKNMFGKDSKGNPLLVDGEGNPAFTADEIEDLALGKAGSEVIISSKFSKSLAVLEDIKEISSDTIGQLGAFMSGTNKGPFLYKKGKQKYYIFFTRGQNDTIIPFYYDGMGWNAFFGVDEKGNFLVDKTLAENGHYNAAVEGMQVTLGSLDTTPAALADLSKDNELTREELSTKASSALVYDQAEVYAAKTPTRKWQIASEHMLRDKFRMLGDVPMTLAQLKTMIEAEYGSLESGPFDMSRPLVFTQGRHKGRAFVLYTYRKDKNLDLSTIDGIRDVMRGLSDFKEDYDIDSAIKVLKQRKGVGVVLLDAPGKNFSQLTAMFLKLTGKDADSEFNRSTVSLKSKSAKRLHSMMMELVWAFTGPTDKGGYTSEQTPKFLRYRGTENKRLKSFMDNLTDIDRTLDPHKLKGFVERILKMRTEGLTPITESSSEADKKKNQDERIAATQFLNILGTMARDKNLGMFRVKGIKKGRPSVEVSEGKELMDVEMHDTKENWPLIFKHAKNVLTYYPKEFSKQSDGSFAVSADRAAFDLAAFLRLLTRPKAVIPGRGGRSAESIELTPERQALVIGIFDSLLDDNVLMPGTLQKGVFASPGMVRLEGAKSFWATLQTNEDLEHDLSSTAKSLNTPGLTFNINALEDAIDDKGKDIADKTRLTNEMAKEAESIFKEATRRLMTVNKLRDDYLVGEVISIDSVADSSRVEFEDEIASELKIVLKSITVSPDGLHRTASVEISGKDESGVPVSATRSVELKHPKDSILPRGKFIVNSITEDFNTRMLALETSYASLDAETREGVTKPINKSVEARIAKVGARFASHSDDIDIEEIQNGTYTLEVAGMTDEQIKLANRISKMLPIVVTEEQFEKLKDALVKLEGTLADETQALAFKNLKEPLLLRLASERGSMKNMSYVDSILEKVKKKELKIAKYPRISAIIKSIENHSFSGTSDEVSGIIHAYITGSSSERAILEPVVGYVLADPGSAEFAANPYTLSLALLKAYEDTDAAIEDIKATPSYIALKDYYPDVLEKFLAKYPLPESRPNDDSSQPKTVAEFKAIIDNEMEDGDLSAKDKAVRLAAIQNIRPASMATELDPYIQENLDMLNMNKMGIQSIVENYVKGLQKDKNISDDLGNSMMNMANFVDTNMGSNPGHKLMLRALEGEVFPEESQELRDYQKFTGEVIDALLDPDSGINPDDISYYLNMIIDISKCNG